MNKIYETNTDTLPKGIAEYRNMKELAELACEALNECALDMKYDVIWARIDELPEALLDILAYDLHIDWYDYSYSLEQKRQTIKTSVAVHKKLGTKYAVETALAAAYPNSSVIPWFAAGGSGIPYTFDVILDISESPVSVNVLYIKTVVEYYKSLRDNINKIKAVNRQNTQMHVGCVFIRRVRQNIAPVAENSEIIVSVKAYTGIVNSVRRSTSHRCEVIVPPIMIRVYDTYDQAIADESNVPYHTVGVYME